MSLAYLQFFEPNLSWASAIARNIARKLPPSFDPKELEQVAFIETWRCALRYDPANPRGTPFRAFAYLPVRGAVLMSIRRRAWREGTAEEISRTHVDPGLRPDERVEAIEEQKNVLGPRRYRQRAWLHAALNELPTADAYLVKRVYLEEADVEELAERLGVESRTLSRRLSGIVKRLMNARNGDRQKCRASGKSRARFDRRLPHEPSVIQSNHIQTQQTQALQRAASSC